MGLQGRDWGGWAGCVGWVDGDNGWDEPEEGGQIESALRAGDGRKILSLSPRWAPPAAGVDGLLFFFLYYIYVSSLFYGDHFGKAFFFFFGGGSFSLCGGGGWGISLISTCY